LASRHDRDRELAAVVSVIVVVVEQRAVLALPRSPPRRRVCDRHRIEAIIDEGRDCIANSAVTVAMSAQSASAAA
jgi:hypothetical protein